MAPLSESKINSASWLATACYSMLQLVPVNLLKGRHRQRGMKLFLLGNLGINLCSERKAIPTPSRRIEDRNKEKKRKEKEKEKRKRIKGEGKENKRRIRGKK